MKTIIYLLTALSMLCVVGVVCAVDRVTIQGPVEIVTQAPGQKVTYYVHDQEKKRYEVTLPTSEQERLALMVQQNPGAVVRFDGTMVNNDKIVSLNAEKWERVTTTTTTTTDDGFTTREQKTTLIEK